MAIKATICKAAVQIADMDRGYYQDHVLTIARHPSETDERMMVRLLAYALHASETLLFGRGISTDDEPDIWQKDLTGAIESWIEVGLPDEKRVRKACGRADQVYVYAYGGRAATLWWDQVSERLAPCRNLTVMQLAPEATRALANLAGRNMKLNCTIQEGQVWIADEKDSVAVELLPIKAAAGAS